MGELIPIVSMVFVLGPLAVLGVSFTPLGRALADRLRGRPATSQDLLALHDEIDRLRDHITEQNHRFEELHERVDFAERWLSRGGQSREELDAVSTPV